MNHLKIKVNANFHEFKYCSENKIPPKHLLFQDNIIINCINIMGTVQKNVRPLLICLASYFKGLHMVLYILNKIIKT